MIISTEELTLFSFQSLLFPAARPGQSNECTNLEYPVGIYFDFDKNNWLHKKSDQIVNASSWLVDPELDYYNPYMNDIVQVVREYFVLIRLWEDCQNKWTRKFLSLQVYLNKMVVYESGQYLESKNPFDPGVWFKTSLSKHIYSFLAQNRPFRLSTSFF